MLLIRHYFLQFESGRNPAASGTVAIVRFGPSPVTPYLRTTNRNTLLVAGPRAGLLPSGGVSSFLEALQFLGFPWLVSMFTNAAKDSEIAKLVSLFVGCPSIVCTPIIQQVSGWIGWCECRS